MDPNSLSFIRFQCILYDSRVFFIEFWNFYKLKRGDLISGGNQFCRKAELFGPFYCFLILSSKHSVSWSFNRFQCILPGSKVLFSEFWNFYKLKRVDLISGGKQFCIKVELFGPFLCIPISKVLWTQILRHSLDFNTFCMIQEYLSQSFEISTN